MTHQLLAAAANAAAAATTNPSLEVLGIRFVGVNPENGHKLLLTAIYLAIVVGRSYTLR